MDKIAAAEAADARFAVAGLVALELAIGNRTALGLGPRSQVLVFGTEGDTDPELYRELVGADAGTVRRGAA